MCLIIQSQLVLFFSDTARWSAGSVDDVTDSSLPPIIVVDNSYTAADTASAVIDTVSVTEPAQSAQNDCDKESGISALQSNATEEHPARVEDKLGGNTSPNPNSSGQTLEASGVSLTSQSESEEELIVRSQTKTNRMSAVDIGKMFSGLEIKLQQNVTSSGSSGSPYDQIQNTSSDKQDSDSGIQVLALHGLFTAREKKKTELEKVELGIETETDEGQLSSRQSMIDTNDEGIDPDDQTAYTGTYTIYQSVTRKTFPLIGSVPTCLLWELQQAAESNEQPPSPESVSSPDLSPAPSPITSPLVQKQSRKQTGLKLFSSPSLKRWSLFKEQGPLGQIDASPDSSPSPSRKSFLRSPRLNRKAKEPISPLALRKDDRPSLPLSMDIITETSCSSASSPVVNRHSISSPVAFSWSSDDTSSIPSRYSWSPTMKQRSASPSLPRQPTKRPQVPLPLSPGFERRQSDPMVDPETAKRRSLVVRRHTSEISKRGFEIRRRIRSRGISLVVGSSSSSEGV